MNMNDVASVVWKQCLMAKAEESALIIADPSGERLEIGKALPESGKKFCSCELVTMKPTGMNGREPWPDVAKKIMDYDIVVAPLEYSITHTNAMETLKKKGIQLIDEKPKRGVEGTSIAFLHPKGTKILLEIVEPGK